MTRWVIENDGTILHIGVSIPTLRIRRIRNDGIRLNEPPQRLRIESCAVIHDAAHARVEHPLTRVGKVSAKDWRVGNRPRFAEGEVSLLGC